MLEGFISCCASEKVKTHARKDNKYKWCECNANENCCINIHDTKERNKNQDEEHMYCCYQNIPFCCESELKPLTPEQKEYNNERCIQNIYENMRKTSSTLELSVCKGRQGQCQE